MTIEVWNRKRLPLAWLRADDDASSGVVVRERDLVDGSRGAARCGTSGPSRRSNG